ncbi:MAG: DUF6265 family protein, partial [Gammaproteobacteria bacterium]
MRRIVFAALLAIATSPPAQADDPLPGAGLESLGWLTGRWIAEQGEHRSEHIWTGVRAGTLLGLQRDSGPDGDTWVEFVNIHETPAGIVFTTVPLGQAQT